MEVYMHIRIAGILLSCVLIFLGFLCQEEKQEPVKEPVAEVKIVPAVKPKEEIPSVCIWDITPVKLEPTQKGRWISSLALGEKVVWLSEEKVDSTDKSNKYLKVRLSDGKEGWVSDYTLATDAKPAVTIHKSIIYLRPDLVTVTNKEYAPMEFVAISMLENEWCEAKGLESKKTGWIKSETVSIKDDDIAVALLAYKALAETNKDKKKEKIEAIINNPLFSKSLFIDTLKNVLSKIPPWDDDEKPPVKSPKKSEDSEDSEKSDGVVEF
jgi:hypothetical protein